MLASRNLKLAGSGIGRGKQRLIHISTQSRQFSARSVTRPTLHISPLRSSGAQQARSLSLFGWGAKSKPSEGDIPASPNTLNTEQNVEIGNSSINEIRTIKASHATSEAPDPSLPHHAASPVEPTIVRELEESISFPSGADKVSDIVAGEIDIRAIPEQLGYLKNVCSLDFGWGPTAFTEWVLEHLHITGGLSWTASIVTIAIITRLALIKPTINAQRESAKLKDLNPIIAPMRERSQQALKEGNRQKQLEISTEMRSIYKEYDVKFSRIFIPILIQAPLQFGAFRLLNAAARLPVPAFVNEDWLWNHDLTFSDPYFITPAISAGFMWIQFRQSSKQQASGSPVSPATMRLIGNILPAASFAFMCMQPGAVQLFFMTTSFFALLSGESLRQDQIRRWLALPSLTPSETEAAKSSASQTTTSSSSSSSSTTKATASAASANGFQIRSRSTVSPSATTTHVNEATAKSAVSDRSGIDRFIDAAKDRSQGFGKNFKEVTKNMRVSVEEQQAAKNQKYEQERSRQLEIDREMRNQAARDREAGR